MASENPAPFGMFASGNRLKHLGLSARRPVYQSYKQDPRKVEQCFSESFPAAVAQAHRRGADVYFVDEASVCGDAHGGRTWGQIGETPVVAESRGQSTLNLISAVSPRGDLRFIAFLQQLRKDAGRPILVIADDTGYHHSAETQGFIEGQNGEITLALLPA